MNGYWQEAIWPDLNFITIPIIIYDSQFALKFIKLTFELLIIIKIQIAETAWEAYFSFNFTFRAGGVSLYMEFNAQDFKKYPPA